MFNKTKNKIKTKLRKWLGIEENTRNIKKNEYTMNQNQYANKVGFINLTNEIEHNSKAIKTLHNTVENVVHIGTDVRQHNHGHSWAVVCIEGKMNIVKFVPLDRRNAMDILHFLKQFEGGRHCIDSPNPVFYKELFKFW